MSPIPSTRCLVLAVVATTLLLAGCGGGDEAGTASTDGSSAPTTNRPTVVATTTILGDVAANVLGDLAEVEVLMPPGTDPHDFEPSAQQAAELRDADLVIANGLGLEEGLAATLEDLAADGVPVFEVAPELSPIPAGETGGDHHDHADGEKAGDAPAESPSGTGEEDGDHGGLDPHVWMDPERMATASALIAAEVAEATGLDAVDLDRRAGDYAERLRATDAEVEATLATIPPERRRLVTNHEALGYFAERYSFEIVGTVIPGGSTLAEPSAAEVAELAEVVRAEQVPAIFAENTDDTSLAETLAAEAGVEVEVVSLYTDALGEPGSGADTYLGLLVTNAGLVAGALAP